MHPSHIAAPLVEHPATDVSCHVLAEDDIHQRCIAAVMIEHPTALVGRVAIEHHVSQRWNTGALAEKTATLVRG